MFTSRLVIFKTGKPVPYPTRLKEGGDAMIEPGRTPVQKGETEDDTQQAKSNLSPYG
jgi:hypothetical protein